MHVIVRRYPNAPGLADALLADRQEVQELLSAIPGFRHYFALRSGDAATTITVCDDETGTAESVRVAREWVQRALPDASFGAPEISEGDVFLDFGR